jgi:hypothetical protein
MTQMGDGEKRRSPLDRGRSVLYATITVTVYSRTRPNRAAYAIRPGKVSPARGTGGTSREGRRGEEKEGREQEAGKALAPRGPRARRAAAHLLCSLASRERVLRARGDAEGERAEDAGSRYNHIACCNVERAGSLAWHADRAENQPFDIIVYLFFAPEGAAVIVVIAGIEGKEPRQRRTPGVTVSKRSSRPAGAGLRRSVPPAESAGSLADRRRKGNLWTW